MSKIERPKSLTEIALDRLRDDIVAGRLETGASLSEGALADSLGISRTPVREALMRLQTEGLVTVVPQKGTFVFTVDSKELMNICDLRVALETAALRFAIERNAALFATALQEIVDDMTKARKRGSTREYLRLDTEFHAEIFRHCDNRYLVEAYQLIAAKMAALRTRLGTDPDHMRKSYEEHGRIAAAVRGRDVTKALSILTGHIGGKEGSYWMTDDAVGGAKREVSVVR